MRRLTPPHLSPALPWGPGMQPARLGRWVASWLLPCFQRPTNAGRPALHSRIWHPLLEMWVQPSPLTTNRAGFDSVYAANGRRFLILFLERKSIKKNFIFARKGSNSKALRPVTKRSFSLENSIRSHKQDVLDTCPSQIWLVLF